MVLLLLLVVLFLLLLSSVQTDDVVLFFFWHRVRFLFLRIAKCQPLEIIMLGKAVYGGFCIDLEPT